MIKESKENIVLVTYQQIKWKKREMKRKKCISEREIKNEDSIFSTILTNVKFNLLMLN